MVIDVGKYLPDNVGIIYGSQKISNIWQVDFIISKTIDNKVSKEIEYDSRDNCPGYFVHELSWNILFRKFTGQVTLSYQKTRR